MKLHRDRAWTRRGLSLLWDAAALSEIVEPADVVSIRQFFRMAKAWPEELPAAKGDALVVAGLEGCLDALSDDDARTWLERHLKGPILEFQMEYEGAAALIFWLPSGRRRISMSGATEEYFWKGSSTKDEHGLPIGRCLWGGAEADVARIIASDEDSPDFDGPAYIGLYHPRIS